MKNGYPRHAARSAAPVLLALLALLALGGDARQDGPAGERPETVSLLGKPLFRTPATGEALAKLESALRDAARKLEAEPDDPEALILYGRALASLWRYRDAIDVYSRGIAARPDHAMLYRHRGHRYITLRKFDEAAADLARAAELNGDDFDIWYHLGLAHYLKGEFGSAGSAYLKCREAAKDEGSVIAVSNWLYLALMRQGQKAEAAKVLDGIKEGMEAGENISYYNLLLFDKGLKTEGELESAAAASDLELATTGYGLACRRLVRGEKDKALATFRKIVALPYWPAFGYIAAEAELHRAAPPAGKSGD
jgi:tetratricopeptide (TPR) repeat protein